MIANKKKIYFAKLREDVKIPSKRDEDAGYDIYANFAEECFVITPHTVGMIPTGLVSAFAPKWRVQLQERGSTGTKGMEQRCGVIDSGYRDEWFVPITNGTNKTIIIAKAHVVDVLKEKFGEEVVIYPYEKAITQAVVVEVPKLTVEELDLETIRSIKSERGMGKLGSSNK